MATELQEPFTLLAEAYSLLQGFTYAPPPFPPLWPRLTCRGPYVTMVENTLEYSLGGIVHARFLGKDPDSNVGDSPTLFATDRTDRKTYIAQGWVVKNPQALTGVGPIPEGEAIVEIPQDVLKFYVRQYREGEH